MQGDHQRHNSSFRDPDAVVFTHQSKVYRQINISFKDHFQKLIDTGLYSHLLKLQYLLSHEDANDIVFESTSHYKTILPQQLPFVSYPYEWCFQQLKDAALLTLNLMKESLNYGMILKDATPFNVQFVHGKCVFIDTTSFEIYEDGKPWVAYRQFCENFFAPLLLMHYSGPDLNKLLQLYPDGIPLKLVSKLLPLRSLFNIPALLHIHFQAGYKASKNENVKAFNMPKNRLQALIDNLQSAINKMELSDKDSTWSNYYDESILSKDYLNSKAAIVEEMVSGLNIESAVDLGANDGYFSLLLTRKNIRVVSADIDSICINNLYNTIKEKQIENIYPLVNDFANPTPATGWDNKERSSFSARSNADLYLVLALLHHLCIARNISFQMVAQTLSNTCNYLIIEFVPKADPKVEILLQYRKDIFTDYTQQHFEAEFGKFFTLKQKETVDSTGRIIYLFERTA